MAVVYQIGHGCTFSGPMKPIILSGASLMFLMIYLALWKFHANEGSFSLSFTTVTTKQYSADLTIPEDPEEGVEEVVYCDMQLSINQDPSRDISETFIPTIYFVTPTYSRPVQIAELTRLGQTLGSVPALHWILVEDADHCSPVISQLLKRLGIPFTHLASAMPTAYKKLHKIPPRGVSNRRAALRWIRSNVLEGVLYFGDDDNSYDHRLFEEIRHTQGVSMFPVGLIGDYAVSAPVVTDGKVIGFYDSWPAGRRYSVDMAGFAVNIRLLHERPNATIIYKAGYEEDHFLQGLIVDNDQIEAKAANCTQILVWHTRTEQSPVASLRPLDDKLAGSSLPVLLHTLDELNLVTFSKKGKPNSVHYLNTE